MKSVPNNSNNWINGDFSFCGVSILHMEDWSKKNITQLTSKATGAILGHLNYS